MTDEASEKPGTICIVMMSAIGDAVHVLPVITALKRHDPAVKITWILQPGPASLVRGHPDIDEILVFEKARGWLGMLDLRAQLAKREFDLVIDLQVYIKAGLVTLFARAPVKLGFDKARARDMNWLFTNWQIPPHAPQHVQDQYLEFLAVLEAPAEPLEWKLGPWPSELARRDAALRDLPRPFATLVIGATHPEKEWLPSRWAEIANALRSDFGLEPVLAGGRSARELETARLIEGAGARTHSTLGVPLRDLVSILDASELVISLDTAPLHMSVALERPVIALMGYNNPKRVGPYRRYHDLLVDAYGDPGEDYPISYAHRLGRMPRITVRDVLDRVEIWNATYRGRASTRS
ncbi:MAG TPA: glycosyltransferase family 9 protein [Gemmatimonadaceae bacterium]|jgi:heptosyltransferase I|nr:glycosyltransferase family 9 protein [Gemmatimonadaceae bacterium]